jgi:putative ABC transport system permease protein
MITVALKGLAGRKVRALLTAFAVVIGVTMVSGTFVLTDTIQKGFDGVFTASYEQTDAVIAGKEIVKGSQSGAATVPASLLAEVRALPEVAAAGGTISPAPSNKAEIFGRDGKSIGSADAPQFGLGVDASQPQFSPLELKTGRWPEGPDQVAIDAGTAADHRFAVGDMVAVSALGAKRRYEVTGIATFGDVNSLGNATMAVWDLATAQEVLGKEGRFDGISIAAEQGTSPDALIRAVQPLVPASLEVKDAEQQAAADANETNVIVDAIRYFLLGFGAIALFVGAFVIFNTLSITVAQRTREFATLRTLGASRRQVMRSVVLEGLVIGLLASVIGLFAGLGLAKLLSSIGGELPEAGMVFSLRTVLVSLALGTVITLLASLMPALRATRVPPIAAVREGSMLPPTRFAAHGLKTAVVVIAASLAAICVGIFVDGLSAMAIALLLGLGILALFVGMALAAPHLVKPLTRLVGLPARRTGGVAGDLANANSTRNPSRTASTAAALMIGLTLVTVVAVLGAGMRATVENAVTDQVDAAYILNGIDGMPFEAAEGDALARVPGVTTASHVRVDKALVAVRRRTSPASTRRRSRGSTSSSGSTARTRPSAGSVGGGALVTETYADDRTSPSATASTSRPRRATSPRRGRPGHLRPARDRPDARRGDDRTRDLRRRLPATQEQVHVPRRRPGRRPGADRGGSRLQRREGAHWSRVRERLHGGLLQLPELPLRAAGLLGWS